MSKKKTKKIVFGHGGARPGAGHPETGITKTKICVSVDKENWETALTRWREKGSRLVDKLVSDYVNQGTGVSV